MYLIFSKACINIVASTHSQEKYNMGMYLPTQTHLLEVNLSSVRIVNWACTLYKSTLH